MRIGYDAKRALANDTGLGTYARLLLEGVSRAAPDWEFHLYAPAGKRNLFAPTIAERDNLILRTPRAPWSAAKAGLWRRLGMARAAKRDGCDVLHGLSHELPAFTRSGPMKTIVTMHDMLPFRMPHLFPWPDRAIYRAKFRHACKAADLVLAVSEQTRQDVIDILSVEPDKVRVQYQACDPRFFTRIEPGAIDATLSRHNLARGYVLFVGAIIERKNLLTLIRAMEALGRESQAVLAVAGKGREWEKKARDSVTERKLEERVRFLGYVENADLPALYRGAQVLAYPSSYEGFGLPIVEALASGTPVITSTGSCFGESGGPGALYVDPGDVDGLAGALAQVLGDAALREELRAKGAEHVRRFHPDVVTQELLRIYRDLT